MIQDQANIFRLPLTTQICWRFASIVQRTNGMKIWQMIICMFVGTENDFENLTYEVDDSHPETCSVRGEAESIFALKGRTLIWRGHLLVTTDQKNFYYKYTRELLKDGQMIKTKTWLETIPRDHQ